MPAAANAKAKKIHKAGEIVFGGSSWTVGKGFSSWEKTVIEPVPVTLVRSRKGLELFLRKAMP